MINREEYFLLLAAPSTHYVMKLEKDLQNYGIWCKIIPLPGEISAGCGLSIRYNLEDEQKVDKILIDENIVVDKYLVHKIGLKKTITKK